MFFFFEKGLYEMPQKHENIFTQSIHAEQKVKVYFIDKHHLHIRNGNIITRLAQARLKIQKRALLI